MEMKDINMITMTRQANVLTIKDQSISDKNS